MAGKDFYSPGEIWFSRQQTLWLIRNLPTLRGGYWPVEDSSYIDIPLGKKSVKHKAYFETPIEYAAEIEARLEHAGVDGLILEAIECWGKSVASLSKHFGKPEWVIWKRRKKALGYVASGPCRRWHDNPKRKAESYQDFKGRQK